MTTMKRRVLDNCQAAIPAWRGLPLDAFTFADPKGFSSFTMGVRCVRAGVEPSAVLYRHLEGKDNAILDFAAERSVFLTLGAQDIAAHCLHYGDTHRIEAFYEGATLTRHDLGDHEVLRGIAAQLHRFHQLSPQGLPEDLFFDRLHARWGPLARRTITQHRSGFPPDERPLCDELEELLSDDTLAKVRRLVPRGRVRFCHNDTYHGNVMRLTGGAIKLLDFEFSCLNHPAFDFANLFAETVTRHGLADPPHFSIAAPEYSEADIGALVDFYLAHEDLPDPAARAATHAELVAATLQMIPLSDYMYAMAALPLAVEPIQKIRFLPYAHARFRRFLDAVETD